MTVAYLLTYFGGVEFWAQYVPYTDDKITVANLLESFIYSKL